MFCEGVTIIPFNARMYFPIMHCFIDDDTCVPYRQMHQVKS
jgi:hypothetical protein